MMFHELVKQMAATGVTTMCNALLQRTRATNCPLLANREQVIHRSLHLDLHRVKLLSLLQDQLHELGEPRYVFLARPMALSQVDEHVVRANNDILQDLTSSSHTVRVAHLLYDRNCLSVS